MMDKLQSTGEGRGGGPEEKEGDGAKQATGIKKQHSCALSRQNSLGLASDVEGASAAKSDGGVAAQEGKADPAEIVKERRRKVRLEPLLDEDASGAASELYESDSSGDHGSFIHANENNSSSSSDKLLGPGVQGQDIVAGSPAKVPDAAAPTQNENEEQQAEKESANQADEERGREEMGGVIVYDSYAKLTGCTKIVDYWAAQDRRKVDIRILFSQQEAKTLQKTLFFEKPRERDFQCDYDRHLWRNLPRFQTQRDFAKPQFSIHVPQQQNVLIFDSRFENGNLRKAAKVNNVEYNLWLENDLNTKGHTQWYYFKVLYKDIAVRADKKTHTIKFNVLNLAKTTSLYQVGMKPCIWSKRRFEKEGVGWFRGGEEVTYTQNNILRETDFTADHQKMQADENNNNAFLYNYNGAGEGVDTYFTLSFKYAFAPNQDDEVWFAHAIPSTYTQLQEGLLKLRQSPEYEPFLRTNMLCQSLAKTPVPLLTITENVDTYLDYSEELRLQTHLSGIVKKSFRQKYNNTKKLAKQSQQTRGQVKALLDRAIEEELRQFFEYNEDHFIQASPFFEGFGQRLINYVKIHSQKKAVIITSRVHPGEPQASHMVNGLIAYLLSPKAVELRRHFVFRIVPMLNPDGVIYGNYRCSLLGCDLNRRWDKPNKYLHPPIYYAKNIVRHMHQERKVLLFCDLHGHSRKQNAFFYGCCYKNYEHEGRIKNARLRIIPLMCCQKNELFQLKGCRFRLERGREATARVAIFKEFNIMNSFTLECSFFGKEHSNQKKRTDKSDPFSVLPQQKKLEHMSQEDYESLGETLMKTMHSYLPGEQHLLEFVSGRILDVFYDEFVKFIPPFMLKREREKREQAEEEARREQGKHQRQDGPGGRSASKPHALNKLATSDLGGQLLMPSGHNNNSTQRSLQRQQTLHFTQSAAGGAQGGGANAAALQGSPQHAGQGYQGKKAVNTNLVGIQEVSVGSSSKATPGGALSQYRNSQDYNGQEDNPQQAEQVPGRPFHPHAHANFNYKDSSSDQQAQNMFLSGNDTDNTNQGHGGRMGADFHSNKEEMLEFETFFDNIQQKMKRKEQAKAQRAQLKDGDAPLEDLRDLSEDDDSGTSSDDQAYKERARRPKKKKKKQQPATYGRTHRTAQRKKELRDDGPTGGGAGGPKLRGLNQGGHRDVAGVKNKSQSTTAAAHAAANRPTRSPRHQQLDSLAPVLASKKAHGHERTTVAPQQPKQEEPQPQAQPAPEEKQGGATTAGVADKAIISGAELTDVRTSELQPCPAEAILRSSEIQVLIKSQLSTGVLNQTEIMQVIQRAILKNQALAQLRAQQNKNRLLVNHPQNDGMPENARSFDEQNLHSAERQRRNQPGRARREPDQLLRPLRIATTDVQGYQPVGQLQQTSPQQHQQNNYQGSAAFDGQAAALNRNEQLVGAPASILFNPARPPEDSKESPLPQPARQAKQLGQAGSFRLQQASAYNQQQSQYSNQLKSQGQYGQQPSLVALQQPPFGATSLRTSDPPAPTKLNSTLPEAHLSQSASQAHRGPTSQLSEHGTADRMSQVPTHSPPLHASKTRKIVGPTSESFSISALPSHSHTVKVEKTRKFQTLCRPGAEASAGVTMLRNATDVRELPSVYEGSPADGSKRRQPYREDQPPDFKRSSQSAMHERLKLQASIKDINQDSSKGAPDGADETEYAKQGPQFRKSVGARVAAEEANGDGKGNQRGVGNDEDGGQRRIRQEKGGEKQQKGPGGLLVGRRSPSVLSPDAGSGLAAARGQGTAHYQPEANRHEFSQPIINSRQQAQLEAGAPGRTENQKKLLQYGGWAMSGYTTMPLKTQLVASEYRESRVSASNNALSKIAEVEPMSAQLPADGASARKRSQELRLASQGYSKQAQAAHLGRGSVETETGRPRPQLHINAQLNASRHNQMVGLSPGTLGAGGLASVGLTRAADGSYQGLAQYGQPVAGAHDRSRAERSEAALQSVEMLAQGHNLQHYGPAAQQQLQRVPGKPQHSNQHSMRQSPTAASAGSTIIGTQRRHPRANVMQDLREQIAHEATALEMLNQQKQLQLQLERQEQLLHQLQSQLISHQLGSQAGGIEGGEAGLGAGIRAAHSEDYQSSLMQIGSVISGGKARARPSGILDARQLPQTTTDPGSGVAISGSPSKALGRAPGRGVQITRIQRNELGQLTSGPEGLSLASTGLRRNQDAADDAIAAALTRSMATGNTTKQATGGGRGGELASARHWNPRQVAGGPTGSASVAQAAGTLLMQGSSTQQARGASTGDATYTQPGSSYHTDGPFPPNHYLAGENAKGTTAPDRGKALASKYDGGLRQSQTKRSLALGDARLLPGTIPIQNPSGSKPGQGLGGPKMSEAANMQSTTLQANGNYAGHAQSAAQGNSHLSPLTNASLLFNNQGLRNAEHPPQARPGMFDEVRSPGLAAADADYGRLDPSMGSGLIASASADRRASQISSNRFSNAMISSGGAKVGPDGPTNTFASALQPTQRLAPSTHLARPSQAHSATKQSSLAPLIVQPANRAGHIDGIRGSGLDPTASHHDQAAAPTHANDPIHQSTNIFSSIEGYRAAQAVQGHKQGLHLTEQKRPVIKKDNILFSSAGASVPSFRSRQQPGGSGQQQMPMMMVSGVGRRSSDQRLAQSRQSGGGGPG